MIRPYFAHSLDILSSVAAKLTVEERETYYEMTGRQFMPDDVAAQLWCPEQIQRIWTFWETVGNFAAAVGGYVQVRPGVWASWFMSTPAAWQRGHEITQAVAECIQHMLEDSTVRRLETVTLAKRTRARAWYEQIGLTYESTACKASATGQDLVTYVALRS